MGEARPLEEVLLLALRLPPGDRLRLVEQVVASVEKEIATPVASPATEEHWGKSLNRLIDTLDMSDWEALDSDDLVEWVKRHRTEEQQKRLGDWEGVD